MTATIVITAAAISATAATAAATLLYYGMTATAIGAIVATVMFWPYPAIWPCSSICVTVWPYNSRVD